MAARRRPGEQEKEQEFKQEIKPIGPFGQPVIVQTPVTSTTVPAAPVPPAVPRQQSVRQFETPAKKAAPKKTVQPKKKVQPKRKVDEKKGPQDKPAVGTTVDVNGEKVVVGGDRWKQIIQEEFGSLWDVYNESPDVKAAIDKAVKEGYYNDETKLSAALSNTNWFRSTQASARQFVIRQNTDPATLQAEIDKTAETIRQSALQAGMVLSEPTVTRLASDRIKFGWSEAQLSNAVGSEVVATAKAGGPTAFAELSRGSTGRRLRQIADSFAIKPSDSMIEEWTAKVMAGDGSEETYTEMVKEQARTMYRSLVPQIDKGMDVQTATAAYTSQASRVLGVDSTQVDWSDAKWNKALNYQDPKTGEYRAMDTWEWDRYLRSLPEWQNTDDAKNLYRTAAFSLAQAFGRTT